MEKSLTYCVKAFDEIYSDSANRYRLCCHADVNKSIRRNMTTDEKKLFGIEKLNVKRTDIPAVTHVDYSARIQTVHKETNQRYYELIKKFNGRIIYLDKGKLIYSGHACFI